MHSDTGFPSVPLGEVLLSVESGWSPVCGASVPASDEWGVLRLSAITSGTFKPEQSKTLLPGSAPRPHLEISDGDVLMSRANGVRSLVGVSCSVTKPRPRLMLPDLAFRLVPDSTQADPEFLAIALSSADLRHQIDTAMRGTSGQYKISKTDVRRLSIPLPSLDAQHRVVAAHAAFEQRITAMEAISAKLTQLESSIGTSIISAENLTHWPTRTLESVASVSAGVTLGAPPSGEGVVELPYLRVANVQDGWIDTSNVKTIRILESRLERFALRVGDVLITEGGDIDKLGRGAVWNGVIQDCLHQNHVFRIRCTEEMNPHFLSLYTSSKPGKDYFARAGKQTTNLASINSTQVKHMPVPVPCREVQDRALAPLAEVRRRTDATERRIAKLRAVQRGVVEELLSGRSPAVGQ